MWVIKRGTSGKKKPIFTKGYARTWCIFRNSQKGKECKPHCPLFPAVQFLSLGSNQSLVYNSSFIYKQCLFFLYTNSTVQMVCTLFYILLFSLNNIPWKIAYVLTSLKFRCCMSKLASLDTRHVVGTQQMLLSISSLFLNK